MKGHPFEKVVTAALLAFHLVSWILVGVVGFMVVLGLLGS